MSAIILSIGDELILGQTLDTNSAWISQQLAAVGCPVLAHLTVGDDQAAIERIIGGAIHQCSWLIISGGLGPTVDDLTRQALAAALHQPLELNQAWLDELDRFFKQRNRPMPDANRIQAMIPRTSRMLFNTCGTAAGIDATFGPENGLAVQPCRVFAMPGVPKEMKEMFTRDVLPAIASAGGGAVILSRTLHTFGIGESRIAELLGPLMDRASNPSVGTTVSGGQVSLRINARFPSRALATRHLDQTLADCQKALGHLIFGEDDQTLQQIVLDLLSKSSPNATLATAESCTGGLLGKMITDIPGSSACFHQGWITYSNDAKSQLLGVPEAMLNQHGAVSEPVAQAMAQGARRRADATYALSITGVAGPDGGTPAKPIGMVCISLAHPNGCQSHTFHFAGDREMVRERSAKTALNLLRYHLLNQPLPQ
ncbi:MAG: competence/damage-inducible protein A [Phycisphaerales bacterium]|jgi:nicotinamide-nucleotide amidase|nr:competence/damage-inducible protein A [Phycisphaerales bacterium]